MNILMPWQRAADKAASAPERTSSIRWMIKADLPQIMRIERESFEFNWAAEDFVRAIKTRNVIGLVCEREGPAREKRVAGYMLYELHRKSFKIINVAVDPGQRRTGIGLAMLASLKAKIDERRTVPGRTEILLTVRETNLGCQLWLRAAGFRAVGVLQREFFDTDEDAYRFRYVASAEAREAA